VVGVRVTFCHGYAASTFERYVKYGSGTWERDWYRKQRIRS